MWVHIDAWWQWCLLLGWYDTSNSSSSYINYLVIVNTLDINLPSSLVNDSHIFTRYTTICSVVNQGSLLNILVTGDILHDFGHVHLSVSNTIYVDLWWCSGVCFIIWCLITTRKWCSIRQNAPNVTCGLSSVWGVRGLMTIFVIIVQLINICNITTALLDRLPIFYMGDQVICNHLMQVYGVWWQCCGNYCKPLEILSTNDCQICFGGIIDSILFSLEESILTIVCPTDMVPFDCWGTQWFLLEWYPNVVISHQHVILYSDVMLIYLSITSFGWFLCVELWIILCCSR